MDGIPGDGSAGRRYGFGMDPPDDALLRAAITGAAVVLMRPLMHRWYVFLYERIQRPLFWKAGYAIGWLLWRLRPQKALPVRRDGHRPSRT